MGNERYSLDKFRAAEKEGREDLTQEEKDLLARYREVKRNRAVETVVAGLGSNPGLDMLASLIADLLDKDRKEMRFGNGEEVQAALEEKGANTVVGQYALGRQEAEGLNYEYDKRAEALRKAAKDFEEFARRVNDRDTAEQK